MKGTPRENTDETALMMGPSPKVCFKIREAHMSMDDESSDEETDMFELRRKAKQDSQAVVAHRGLPADTVRETRRRGPLQSLIVLQDAFEVLEVITSQPSQTALQQKLTQESQDAPQESFAKESLETSRVLCETAILDAVSNTPRPTRPTSAKSVTSRPSRGAGSRKPAETVETPSVYSILASKPPLSLSMVAPKPGTSHSTKTCGLPRASRLPSRSALPPVIPPSKSAAIGPSPPCPSKSAMELDLGIGGKVASEPHGPSPAEVRRARTPKTPERKRQSQSLGSLRDGTGFSKQAPHISLPSLPGVAAAAGIPQGTKSVAKMRTGSVGAPVWDIPPAGATLQWDSRRLLC